MTLQSAGFLAEADGSGQPVGSAGCCETSPATPPTAPAAGCSSARRPTPRDPRAPGLIVLRADGALPGEVAVARVLTASGRWVVLHGASLASGGATRTAVIVEPAHPARIAPLLMAAYGLTEREQEVARLVLQGESTAGIAGRLAVSPHTVQQHLKGIFEKTGVRSRRELTGRVFLAHYEPRVRDNERRALAGRPARGGPMAVRPGAPAAGPAPPPAPPG